MSNDFQQTVNLRENMKEKPRPKQNFCQIHKQTKKKAEEIDQIYDGNQENKTVKQNLRKINRPKIKQINEPIFKRVIILLAVVLVGLTVYWLFFKGEDGNEPITDTIHELKWYSVKLITDEVYYGQISDAETNPVVISNVYYNYDQLKDGEAEKSENSNLRLVKRGKETHGPSGTMYIYQVQIEIIDELSQDSKVLKAILDYEK